MNKKYLSYIRDEFGFKKINESEYEYNKNENKISIFLDKENYLQKWFFEDIKAGHKRIWDLKKEENIITLILVLKLLKIGYSKDNIVLEKSLPVGHGGYQVDISLEKNKKIYYLVEVKTPQAIGKYAKDYTEKKIKQLISYLHQNKSIKIGFYYTFHFDNKEDEFYSIEVTEDLRVTDSPDDFFNEWNKIFENVNPLNYPPFNINTEEGKKFSDLKEITERDAENLYEEFLKILRLNSVSDKSNAFDKLINLFIAKVYDERSEGDHEFEVKKEGSPPIPYKGLQFQFLKGNIDNDESFMLRLSDLYKEGMRDYLKKEISDHSEKEIEKIFSSREYEPELQEKILKVINDLRLRKSNAFAFVEVFDKKTFKYNFEIVKKIVELLSKYKFRYSKRSSYLGNFFEDLLNTSLKQEFGQFFTPYPLVDFMINALPLEKKLKESIQRNELPRFVDYACGSGHFLISYMESLQGKIDNFDPRDYPRDKEAKQSLELWKKSKYGWARDYVFGIEKDYRLAKTTKISLFLTGDGRAETLHADALNKFSCDDYQQYILASSENKNEVFDFVVSNPPFSVEGYMQNLKKMEIEFGKTFELIKEFNDKNTMIEIAFLERSWQLLKEDGFAFIILPHNFLSVGRYGEARKWMLKNFQILAIFCGGESSFWGTTASPAIFFMKKNGLQDLKKLDYQCLLINSPKALSDHQKVEGKEEENFLGYKFSKSRKKKGISEINGGKNLMNKYSPLIRKMCLNSLNKRIEEERIETDKYSRFVTLKEIILNDYRETKKDKSKIIKEGNIYAFYPRYVKKIKKENEFCLKEVCEINKHSKDRLTKETTDSLEYVEIGKLNEKEIIGELENDKKPWRLAKKGDLLFPKLAASNWKEQIRIANKDFKVSSAIYTLTFYDEKTKEYVCKCLKENKNDILKDIKSLSDGFKISKLEITEFNLMNNIYFAKEENK